MQIIENKRIYLTCNISNPENRELDCVFNESFSQSIIDNPKNYTVCIVSFNINQTSLPIFEYKNDLRITFRNQISLIEFDMILPFISRTNPLIPGRLQPVFETTQFSEMVNAALSNLHLLSGGVGSSGISPPFLYFDTTIDRLSFYIPVDYNQNIYINENLNLKMPVFSYYLDSITPYKYQILNIVDLINQPTIINATNYNVMKAYKNNIDDLSDIQNILITSNNLMAQREINTQNGFTNYSQNQVLQSFFLVRGENFDTGVFQYISSGLDYRIELKGDDPLRNLNLAVVIRRKDGSQILLKLAKNETAFIKLCFKQNKEIKN